MASGLNRPEVFIRFVAPPNAPDPVPGCSLIGGHDSDQRGMESVAVASSHP